MKRTDIYSTSKAAVAMMCVVAIMYAAAYVCYPVQLGKLTPYHIGVRSIIPSQEVEEYIRQRATNAAALRLGKVRPP